MCVGLSRDYHIKWSKPDRERQILHGIIYMWNLKKEKKIQMNLCTKQKQTHRLWKQTYGYQGGNMKGRDKLGVWD